MTVEHPRHGHPPPAVAGRRIKIRYMTQLRARPPYFVIFGNQLDALPTSYERFLVNGLRETFALPVEVTEQDGRFTARATSAA